jgi:hypothetical protein
MLTSVTVSTPQGAVERFDPATLLDASRRDRVRADANRWIKSLRLVRYEDGRSMRERFTYRNDSLWWFTELYLHKMRRLEDALATVFALEAAVERATPQRLAVTCSNGAAAAAARAFATARRLPVDVKETSGATPRVDTGLVLGGAARALRRLLSGQRPAGRARVAAFVHTAFWRQGQNGGDGREGYIGEVLDAVAARVGPGDMRLVGVGPRRNFNTRRWWDTLVAGRGQVVTPVEDFAPRGRLSESIALWRQSGSLADAIAGGDGIRAAGWFGDYDLWPVLDAELRDAARIQWPWSARAMDEARAALSIIEPDVAVTYAEAGGWGRALVLEARRLGIATIGLQHGFIYRHWLNYQHEPDEMCAVGADAGFPHPSETLVFDRYAASTLEASGHFPAPAVRITGSARLDGLVARLDAVRTDRTKVRLSLGLGHDDRLLVLAAKASEIAPHLGPLYEAVRQQPGVRLVIKPHPAETPGAYGATGPEGAIQVHDPQADLGRLLAIADGLVTMNSTVAIDALVLGVPALVLGLPNNLSPFVADGVMAGASDDGIGAAIQTLLYDRAAREALLQRGRAFAQVNQLYSGGHAASRAADAILAAGSSGAQRQ